MSVCTRLTKFDTSLPVTGVQICHCGSGDQVPLLVQVDVSITEGTNPSSHLKFTVPPSLMCTKLDTKPLLGDTGLPQLTFQIKNTK